MESDRAIAIYTHQSSVNTRLSDKQNLLLAKEDSVVSGEGRWRGERGVTEVAIEGPGCSNCCAQTIIKF